jgi:hypothetical protein
LMRRFFPALGADAVAAWACCKTPAPASTATSAATSSHTSSCSRSLSPWSCAVSSWHSGYLLDFFSWPFSFLKWMAEAMGVPLETENEEPPGTSMAFTRYHFKRLKCFESWEPGLMADMGSTLDHGKFPRSFDLPEVGPLADALEGKFCVNHSCSR